MEPVTHILTGACLARAGFNRRTAYATAIMAIAAEFPDVDTIWNLRGPVEGFTHHRGITHTFFGLPFEAAFLLAVIYAWHRWRAPRRKNNHPPLPPRWGLLYLFAIIALCSHLLLDYTNNYGIRPFFPFDNHWYAASIVFIVDPAILLLLFTGLIAPALFGLISSEVGSRKAAFRGRGWAIAALLAMGSLWVLRATQHNRAINLAMNQSVSAPSPASTPALNPDNNADTDPPDPPPTFLVPQQALASPDPFSPFRWSVATDLGTSYQLADADTRNSTLIPAQSLLPKPSRDAVILLAERSPLGRAYMDWSSMPVLTLNKPSNEASPDGSDPQTANLTLVTLQDARFMGGWMHDTGRSPLVATIYLDPKGHVVRQALDGRVEH